MAVFATNEIADCPSPNDIKKYDYKATELHPRVTTGIYKSGEGHDRLLSDGCIYTRIRNSEKTWNRNVGVTTK